MIVKRFISVTIAIVFIACNPVKETTRKETKPRLPHNTPIAVYCQPEYLKDSLEYYLKEKKYNLIGAEERERLMKRGLENFFTEIRRQGITDKDETIEKLKRTQIEYYSLSVKFGLDSIKNKIDSVSWSVLGFPSMTTPSRGVIAGGQYKWSDKNILLRLVVDTLVGGR